MFSTCFISLSVLLIFSSINYLFCLYVFFYSISSNIDELLSISPSANVFVFGDFNFHPKDWLTFSGEDDKLGELCYNFSIFSILLRWLTFLLRFLTLNLTVLLFWISSFLLTLVFILQWLYFHLEILIVSFSHGCFVS